ncbi:hypothetical protein [Ferroacidibacillus organovorans]|uniref:hypothetical protein n=1 Tax=Ferroacidibacillus organovorans TaxID=1765683 RepID=UPI001366231D|nr:hypothetical protein [Ferroacidibacillus organovorans]
MNRGWLTVLRAPECLAHRFAYPSVLRTFSVCPLRPGESGLLIGLSVFAPILHLLLS